MTDCTAEMCPMWDGHGCPCQLFGLDPANPPTDGVFTIEIPQESLMTDPATRTYAETWPGRGVPMDELAAYVARAADAGAPLTARIRLQDADRNVLLGLTIPGTRMSVTWPYGQSTTPAGSNVAHSGPGAHPGSYDETEVLIARDDARYRQERAKGGIVDPKRLALVGEPTPAPETWPFKPGDVVTDAEGAITEQLDAAPEATVVVDHAGEEWTNDGTQPGDEVPTWVRGDRTSPAFADRIASARLALSGHLTVVRVGAPSWPTEAWPFKPGDVVDDVEGAIEEWLDAAPEGTVVKDVAGDVWKHEGLSSWVGTYRIASSDVAARGPLTVVRIGETGE